MKEIPSYNGKYLVSKDGDVYSNAKNRLLKPYKSIRGYLVVRLNKKNRPIHQLVAETYIDSDYKQGNLVVDHINRDKLDNRLINLRLISKSENYRNSDYYDNRKRGGIYKRPNGNYSASITKDGARTSKTFKTLEEAEEYLTNNQ